jgi:4-hydroxymandelate oxidase
VGQAFTPDTSTSFLGQNLSMPILGSSTAGIEKYNHTIDEVDFCRMTIRGCREAGSLTFRGDTWFYTLDNHPGMEALEQEGGSGIPIFKPRSQEDLKRLIERAERAGCPGVGIDLDGCGSTIMASHGHPVFRKSRKEIEALTKTTSLPFIVKGIMCADDADGCADAGVQVVSVSNHGGRVLDHTPGVAEVLPSIVERVGGRVIITADGGIRTGYDVYKMLALGADIVLSGRDVIRGAVGGGTRGVKLQMERFQSTLAKAMVMTACPGTKDISRKNLLE